MNETIEKRKGFIINVAYIALLLGLAYVFLKYLFWLVAPFLFAFLFAVILQRPLRAIDKKTHKKGHGIISVLLVVLSICIVVVPVAFIIASVIDKITDFVSYIMAQLNDIPTFLANAQAWLLDTLSFLPKGIYDSVSDTIVEAFTKLTTTQTPDATAQAVDQLQSTVPQSSTSGIDISSITGGISSGLVSVFSVVKNVPSILISVVIAIIAWIFFTKDYDYVVGFIKHQLPEGKKNILVELKQVFNKTIVTMFKAYGIIMCITFLELFLGFFVMTKLGIMKNDYYILIAVATAIFDILPIAGSGGVLIPWTIVSAAMGNYKQAVGLMILYGIMTIVRQYIEPKIVGSSLGVHPLVTLMGLYFGLKLFGFMGMIMVPLAIMTLKAFNDSGRISIWKINSSPRN